MPELPEVEVMRRYFEEVALGKEIEKVSFHDKLDKIFKSSRAELENSLVGKRFLKTERIGKYLFAQISNKKWLHLHFGMTGNLEVFRSEELPKYTRFVLHFSDRDKLAYRDLRKFGVIQITESPIEYQKEHKLGNDLLKVSEVEFIHALKNRKVAIKTALLNQKHFAGIGNWIADEMLFNCGIHPKELCINLNLQDFSALLKSGKQIVEEAIKADTHYGDFPDHFFVNYRKEGARHPQFPESPVQRMVVGGRGTFIVPQKQRKVDS